VSHPHGLLDEAPEPPAKKRRITMGTEVLQLAPPVSYLPCVAFHPASEDAELCEGCGWGNDDHDLDIAA
jgi:hypothetical protein